MHVRVIAVLCNCESHENLLDKLLFCGIEEQLQSGADPVLLTENNRKLNHVM